MIEIENLIARLRQLPAPQIVALSNLTGIKTSTIKQIRRGAIKSPQYCNAATLMRALGIFPRK